MRKMLILLFALGLAGCATQAEQPRAPMTLREWCKEAMVTLGSGTREQRAALLEMMRNRGCMDLPPR